MVVADLAGDMGEAGTGNVKNTENSLKKGA
jgi:hypothetical protein